MQWTVKNRSASSSDQFDTRAGRAHKTCVFVTPFVDSLLRPRMDIPPPGPVFPPELEIIIFEYAAELRLRDKQDPVNLLLVGHRVNNWCVQQVLVFLNQSSTSETLGRKGFFV